MKQRAKIGTFVLLAALSVFSVVFPMSYTVSASAAETGADEIYYMDESYYVNDGNIMPMAMVDDDETIAYDSKVVTENETGSSFPCFENGNFSLRNTCAPLAGTVLLGYYDRWYESLIPGYNTFNTFINRYYGFSSNEYIQSAFERLYTLTKTNVGHDGTTEAEFVDGLNEYVEAEGLEISYNSVLQSGTINLSLMDTYLDRGQPVLLLCKTYNIISALVDTGEQVIIHKQNSNVAHMMVAYGYEHYSYYRNGVNFRTDTYLKVASGVFGGELCYSMLNADMELVKAWAIDIYE